MAVRRFAAGQQLVEAGCDASSAARFEADLPRLALFCLRITKDAEKAALLAERVLVEACRRTASSDRVPRTSALLLTVLRDETRLPACRSLQPFQEGAGVEVEDGGLVDAGS
jgi:hypothetical protein